MFFMIIMLIIFEFCFQKMKATFKKILKTLREWIYLLFFLKYEMSFFFMCIAK